MGRYAATLKGADMNIWLFRLPILVGICCVMAVAAVIEGRKYRRLSETSMIWCFSLLAVAVFVVGLSSLEL